MSNLIDLDSKYIQAISNTDIDVTRDLRLTSMKKYQRHTGQIKKKVNRLYKNWISPFATFVKNFWRIYDNEKMTENMKIS